MLNPATVKTKELNSFTAKLIENQANMVRLRNGTAVRVIFKKAESSLEEDCFYTKDWSMCWDMRGISLKNSEYDMMELLPF